MRAGSFWRMAVVLIAGMLICAIAISEGHAAQLPAAGPLPTPTYDPFVLPILPVNPSQEDLGKYLYYFNCMPCHGDLGQGLTDAFRLVWEEDHQNCWGRGCHGGRERDEGFPIPTAVPVVILEGDALPSYSEPQALFDYLKSTHPPQAPGRLSDAEYQELTAYLWAANGKPVAQPTATRQATAQTATPTVPAEAQHRLPLPTCGASVLLWVGLVGAITRQRR